METQVIGGFVWDSINTEKIDDHGLEREDIEGLFDEAPVVFQHPKYPQRWMALGFVPEPDDRFLLVSFEINDTSWVRVVTAFEPTNEKWWRIYAKAKGIQA
ncbi:MAG: hypothetical protein A2289_08920 [Deltaproteobacteria bacterium RIFOXYA12_FULL_58_15]|nr:MAG: hypothetical protein A2289_08920 [Deltaproteobacteria bacterium RIFOXYA12_FULL_58_15]